MTRPRYVVFLTATACGVALGTSTVALPLLALEAGHSAERIGFFTGAGALTQLTSRAFIGALLRRFPDRMVIAAATVALTSTFAAVSVFRHALAFVAAASLEGMARALFWTGIQTHVVRGQKEVGSNIAKVTLAGYVGLGIGPTLAGALLDVSPLLSLGWGALCSALALAGALRLDKWPPFSPPKEAGRVRVWRRRPVVIGSLATGVAGSWRGLLSSYVPVALVAGSQTSAGVGLAVTLGSGANMLAALALVRQQPRRQERGIVIGCAVAGLGIGVLGLMAGSAVIVILCLVASGFAAGMLQITGASYAAQGVHPEERGDVLALTGLVRAAAIMATPVFVAVMLHVVPLGAALAMVGALLTVSPVVLIRRARGDARP